MKLDEACDTLWIKPDYWGVDVKSTTDNGFIILRLTG